MNYILRFMLYNRILIAMIALVASACHAVGIEPHELENKTLVLVPDGTDVARRIRFEPTAYAHEIDEDGGTRLRLIFTRPERSGSRLSFAVYPALDATPIHHYSLEFDASGAGRYTSSLLRLGPPVETGRFVVVAMLRPAFANVSSRMWISGDSEGIMGFVVDAPEGSMILVRAIGVSLRPFGVPLTLGLPQLTIHDATGATVATRERGSAALPAIVAASAQVGAFPPELPSQEAAFLGPLPRGAYTITLRSEISSLAGEALIEVYHIR